jgi:hypothetical protein
MSDQEWRNAIAAEITRLTDEMRRIGNERNDLERRYRMHPENMSMGEYNRRMRVLGAQYDRVSRALPAAKAGKLTRNLADPTQTLGEAGQLTWEAARRDALVRA